MEAIMDRNLKLGEESEFGNKSILGLFWKYSLFALLGLMCQCIQVVFDGYFIGNGVGEIGLAVISVSSVLWQFALGICGLLGIGGSTLAAIKLGGGDKEAARLIYGTITIFSFILSVIIAAVICFNLDAILIGMGATPELLPDGRVYVIIFAISFPFVVTGSTAYYFTRLAEKPFIAALVYVIPAFLAIAIEYHLIFNVGMGAGASSVAGGFCAGFCFFLLPYLQFGKTIFKIRRSDFRIDIKIVWESCKIGFVMFILPVSIMGAVILTNNLITQYGGTETHLAAFGIAAGYIVYILSIVTTAFITGIAPIASYNYGAKLYKRVMSLIRIGVVQSSVVIAAAVILVYIFVEPVVGFFTGPDPVLQETTVGVLQIFLLLTAFGNVPQIASGYFLAVDRPGIAILNGVARMSVFAIALLLVLPGFFGLKGIWMAQPGADALSFILALVFLFSEFKRLKKLDQAMDETRSGSFDIMDPEIEMQR